MRMNFEPILYRTWVGAAVTVGTAGYKIYEGEHAKSQAKKAAKNNPRPTLGPDPYAQRELSMAEANLGGGGMSVDAERGLVQSNQQSSTNAYDAILKGGGDVNNIARIFDGSKIGNQRLAMMRENSRMQNINNYVSASRNADQARQETFKVDQFAPWADFSQANANRKQQAQQDITSGIDGLASGIAGGVGSYMNAKAYGLTSNGMGNDRAAQRLMNSAQPTTVSTLPVNTGLSVGATPAGGQPLNLNFNSSADQNLWAGNYE